LRAPERTRALLECFGRAALGGGVGRVNEVFDLERLKQPFHPLPDAPDTEEVRVKSLCLRYPEHAGRRKVLLDTLAADAPEAIDGPHGAFLRACQAAGFLSTEPAVHPCPSCPHCGEGVPYQAGGRLLCPRCYSDVDPRHLGLWPLDGTAFCRWLAESM